MAQRPASPAASGLIMRDPFPRNEAPSAAQSKAPLAPWPLVDKYPLVIGAGLTLAYCSNVLRLSITGYRREMVDLGRELLERDGATKSLLAGRFATVACGRVEVSPCALPEGHPDKERAKEISEVCRAALLGIPNLKQHLFNLLWAGFYGVATEEIGWKRSDARILPFRLYTIANRRIAYPDSMSWDAHIWDQGEVLGPKSGRGFQQPTNGPLFGLNVAERPNQFIVHTPSFAGDYPTREGLIRELMAPMIFKILGLRCGATFVERFTRIVFYASYATQNDGHPREANEDDIAQAFAALQQLGLGALAGAVLADSIKLHMEGPATKSDAGTKIVDQWVNLQDAQIAVIIRGSNLTTQPGKFGSKGSGDTGELAEAQIEKFDAELLAETLTRDFLGAIVRVNFPNEVHLTPKASIHIDDPSPAAILKLSIDAAGSGIPVDADDTAERVGLRVVPNPDPKTPRRMAPLKPIEIPASILGADIAQAQQMAQQQAADAAAEAAAKQALRSPPGNDTTEPDEGDQEPRAAAAE